MWELKGAKTFTKNDDNREKNGASKSNSQENMPKAIKTLRTLIMDNGYVMKAKNLRSCQRLAFWAGLQPASAES